MLERAASEAAFRREDSFTACTFAHTGAIGQKVAALSRAFSVAVCPIPCAILLAS